MNDIEQRAAQAEKLWTQGDAAQSRGDLKLAYEVYTQAHDLIMDCARLHLKAHRKLQPITRLHKNRTEYYTDTILIFLAPLGIFELLALIFRSRVGGAALCKREISS